MKSIWAENVQWVNFDRLDGDKKTDVLIIGGGIAGIMCAYKLKKAGVDCMLVEADKLCGGVTENTTAKITIAHGLIYDKLIYRFGDEKARQYLEAQKNTCREYEEICQKTDCDYEKKDSYVYSLYDLKKIERECEALNFLGIDAEVCYDNMLPFDIAGAVLVKNQAQFHPLKFLYAIAKELPIYENTKVLELKPGKAVTNRGEIRYKKLIIATHFPILNKHGAYFLKLYQHRSYVLALENAPKIDGMYVDESDTGLSFRNYGDVLLLGGGAHRTGKKGGCWQELEDFAEKYYKNARPIYKWATQDCMSLDGVPYIGQYSKSTPNVFVATGFNKWGMTNSMVAANLLCDLVMGKQNLYEPLFSPARSIFHPQLAVNAIESLVGLLTPTAPRCPHLGCALKYNRTEHSWDCACHGSRFSESGEVINNPATDDKKNMPKIQKRK